MGRTGFGFAWAQRFNESARTLMTTQPGHAPALQNHTDFARAVPTPDHFLPLLYIAGLASAAERPLQVAIDGYALGSLSMTCYTLDAPAPTHESNGRPAAAIPDPAIIPPQDTNL
jgi:4,5-DOPA dioxygenase extradiol